MWRFPEQGKHTVSWSWPFFTVCWGSVTAPSSCQYVHLRIGCQHLPSPQTRSSAVSSTQSSPGRSPALCLVKVKILSLIPILLMRACEQWKRKEGTIFKMGGMAAREMFCIRLCSLLQWQDDTWHFEASKGHLHRSDVVVVDETGACLEVFHHTMSSPHIPTDTKVNFRVFWCYKSVFFRKIEVPLMSFHRTTWWKLLQLDPTWCH